MLKKFITFILITAFIGRLASPLTVLAQSSPPSAPSAPSAPGGPPSAPSAPSGPSGPPPPPDFNPTAPSAPSTPSAPGAPGDVLPTGETLPTGDPLPTGQSFDPLLTGSQSSSAETSSSGSTGSSDQSTNGGSYSGNDPYNLLTGYGSTNYGQEIIRRQMEELNKNLAETYNKVEAMTSTGFNYADLNTLNGEIFTGDVISTVNLLNKLNSNISGLGTFSTFNLYGNYLGDIALQFTDGSPLSAFVQASETVAKNSISGPFSSNYSISDSDFTVKEVNGNDAKINNDINLSADTGNNSASFNTGSGVIQTGDATALGNIINLVNTNINVSQWLFAVLNIFGELAGNIILPQDSNADNNNPAGGTQVGNQNTGPASTNYASSTSNTTAEFTNTNNADIVSTLDVSANTGNNNASINTGGGYVATGIADAAISNSTVANSNTVDEEGVVWLVIVNELGKWVGHILGNPYGVDTASNSLPVVNQTGGFGEQSFSVYSENKTTGPGSTNVSQISENEETIVTNNNNAVINNDINANANTGDNQAVANTGAGVIKTGDANVGLSLLNMANTNVVAKKFVVVFVNVLGSFLGDIIPTGQWEEAYYNSYYQGTASNNQNSDNISPLPTLAPLPTIAPLDDDSLPVGGVEDLPQQYNAEPSSNNYYSYNYYYPNQTGDGYYYYYPQQYVNSVYKVAGQRNKLTLLKNQYAASSLNNQPEAGSIGQARQILRGTTITTTFVKATQSSGLLIGGLSLKVNNSWLMVVPLAVIIYVLRRRHRLNIDFNRYINMLLEIIL
ncbi:hypothetical protein A3I51_04770 [Candidatus Gottesmanbacteria bacterium RIFCSPLOWO2_02_FULL_38_8]|uniref:Uncharacterized protein n=1 Tax=Candidatus Gottesmanbacteria bacterium RIFCSPLOWO2_02_FULL_38_8 TaxID=1798397 RepID=A0A1F6B2W9_9BACT|nr:MAG: hypothetical protein A3I51_04770 [Candidatus Gottesmanbacteria bacterium RIFCSPLOWO2_02_FULL_38_8]